MVSNCVSVSETVMPVVKLSFIFRIFPFSHIMHLPEYTLSVVDSPSPALAYTYVHIFLFVWADIASTIVSRLSASSAIAELFTTTVAPDKQLYTEGATGRNRSSPRSAAIVNDGRDLQLRMVFVPKGTV